MEGIVWYCRVYCRVYGIVECECVVVLAVAVVAVLVPQNHQSPLPSSAQQCPNSRGETTSGEISSCKQCNTDVNINDFQVKFAG